MSKEESSPIEPIEPEVQAILEAEQTEEPLHSLSESTPADVAPPAAGKDAPRHLTHEQEIRRDQIIAENRDNFRRFGRLGLTITEYRAKKAMRRPRPH